MILKNYLLILSNVIITILDYDKHKKIKYRNYGYNLFLFDFTNFNKNNLIIINGMFFIKKFHN